MAKKAKVDYDYENDVLYVYTGNTVKDSMQIEDFVIDFSGGNRIVGVEVMNASKTLSELAGFKLAKNVLSKIKNATISVRQGKEIVYIFLLLTAVIKKEKTDVRIPVVAPTPMIRVHT